MQVLFKSKILHDTGLFGIDFGRTPRIFMEYPGKRLIFVRKKP